MDVQTHPKTRAGNRYVVVFVDYLTKWPEAFATTNHRAETIVELLVEIVCQHGVPEMLLSDRGSDFLSDLIPAVCSLLNIKKINTSAYHSQTDGVVQRINRTLISMVTKHVEFNGHECDKYLPFLLFAYRVKIHRSTQESPFFRIYGRDARLPTETALAGPTSAAQLDVDDNKVDTLLGFSTAWESSAK